MTIIANINPVTREIFLHADTVGVDFQPMDAYTEMRTLRASNEALRPFDVFLTAQGNDPTGPTSATPRRVVMEAGTRFIPFDAVQNLVVVGEVITSDGGKGLDAFDRTGLVNNVNIDYVPPQVEIITVTTGGSTLTVAENAKLMGLPDQVSSPDKESIADVIFSRDAPPP